MSNFTAKKEQKEEKKVRRIRVGLIIAILAALAVLLTIFFISNKVSFLIKDELNLKLYPLNYVFSVKNNEQINLNFTITNNNLAQCKTECNFSLKDLRNKKTVYSNKENLNHNEKRTKDFTISAAGKGSGQTIYNFEAECRNIKTVLCQSSDEKRYVSALILVNYDLTDEEKTIKESTKEKLEYFVSQLHDLSLLSESNDEIISVVPNSIAEKKNLTEQNNDIKSELKTLEEKEGEVLGLWNNENYMSLKSSFSEQYLLMSESLKNKSNTINERTAEIIQRRNNDLNILNNVADKKGELLEMTNFYHHEKNENNNKILEELSYKINNIHDAYYIIKSDEKVVEETFNSNLNSDYSNINTTISNYQKTKSDGLKLLIESQDIINSRKNETKLLPIEFNCSVLSTYIIEIDKLNNNSAPNESDRTNNERNTEFYSENCRNEDFSNFDISEILKNLDDFNLSSSKFEKLVVILPDITVSSFVLNENNPKCCIFNDCEACCDGNECNTEDTYPVLFIHGHSVFDSNDPNVALFTEIQKKLNEDGFINAGELDLNNPDYEKTANIFRRMSMPFTFRSSYYYISQYAIGDYKISVQKSERIENYALRLKEIIDLIKYRTGKDKVNIVAHSMGGLVTREYLSIFGYNNVNKVILINTPNHGVSGKVKELCSVFGSKKECEDMNEGSIFLARLNNQKIPETAKIYSIRSVGCPMDNDQIGDGIVTNSSAYLEGAQNFVIKGKCTDSLQTSLHEDVLKPEKYPEMYDLVEKILKE
jgi:hypothetical protein